MIDYPPAVPLASYLTRRPVPCRVHPSPVNQVPTSAPSPSSRLLSPPLTPSHRHHLLSTSPRPFYSRPSSRGSFLVWPVSCRHAHVTNGTCACMLERCSVSRLYVTQRIRLSPRETQRQHAGVESHPRPPPLHHGRGYVCYHRASLPPHDDMARVRLQPGRRHLRPSGV